MNITALIISLCGFSIIYGGILMARRVEGKLAAAALRLSAMLVGFVYSYHTYAAKFACAKYVGIWEVFSIYRDFRVCCRSCFREESIGLNAVKVLRL